MQRTILVFGATGACGTAVIERALARDEKVTAFVRDEAKAQRVLPSDSPSLRIVEGDVADREQVTSAIDGHDAVISCLASFEPPHDQMSRLAKHVIHSAQALGRPQLRFITYSLCGVDVDGDAISHGIQRAMVVLSPGKFGPAIADHRRVIAALEESSLNYTLFQTATMVGKPIGTAYRSGSPQACPGARLWHRLGLLDAADVCLESIGARELPKLQMRYGA